LILEKTEEINWNDIFRLNLINIFWVNVHGSWLLLIGMYIWREISRKIFLQKRLSWQQLVAVLTFILSSLINPFGYKIFSYVFLTSSLSKKRLIPEWAAPTFSGPFQSQTIIYFLLVILMLGYGIYLFKKNRSQLNTILTSPFVPLAFLGLQSIRNTALPFFVVIPFACHFLFEQGKQVNQTEKKSFLNLIIVGFACLVGIAFLPMVKPYVRDFLPENKKEVFEKTTPVNIAKFLNQTKDSDPVFNAWEFGSYFTLEQKHPIFIDTRNIIFTDEEFEECLKIIETRNDWELVLSKYKVRYIALNRKESGHLISVLNHSSNWENVLMDDESILFQKK
jgi:hypothetical protein